ncbi:hypothetical protein [Luteimonas marina]|uniref:hypothetical protein n=1 Tax=Luteimonas marina TaxID=488485 RepID=UPI001864B18E|nr:hypothetical protein [Luteimonas marina]
MNAPLWQVANGPDELAVTPAPVTVPKDSESDPGDQQLWAMAFPGQKTPINVSSSTVRQMARLRSPPNEAPPTAAWRKLIGMSAFPDR